MPNLLMKTIVRGVTGSFMGLLVAHPFDTVKNRLQTVGQIDFGGGDFLYTGAIDCFIKIIRREGVLSLYKGITFSLVCLIPLNLITFSAYEVLSRHVIRKKEADLNDFELTLLAALSGAIPSVLTNPLERIKLFLQVPSAFYDDPNTSIHIVRRILNEEGIVGMWRGLSLTIIRDASVAGLSCLSYTLLTEKYLKDEIEAEKKTIGDYIPFGICGGISGVVGWISAVPIDFIKTRFQSVPHSFYESGLKDAILHVRDEASFRNVRTFKYFFTGGKLVVIRAFFQYAAMFIGYEVYKELTRDKSILELYQEEDEEDDILKDAEPVVPFFSEIPIPNSKGKPDPDPVPVPETKSNSD